MILAQALHRVEQIEGYPLAENAMCRAIIALASPINVGDFPLDTFHVKGFNIRGDLVPTIGLSNFPTMDTPLSALVADSVNASADPGLDRLRLGFLRLHGIDESYLGQPGPVAAVQSAAITLHKECVVGSFTVTPATSTVRMGDSVSFSSAVVNENGRALPNRSPGYQTQHPWGSMHDSTFTAVLPREDTVVAVVGQLYNSRVNGHAQVTIPLADITVHYTEVNETYWAVDSVRNWRLGVDLPPPSAPTWDGSAGDCSRSTTQQDGYSGTTFFSQRCSRVLDLPDEGRPEASFSIADERYAAAIASYKVHDFEYQTGQLLDIRRCGIAPYDDDGHYCWDRITVHAYDANGHAIARGKTCTVGCVDGGNYGPTGVKRGRLIAPSSTSKRPRSTRP
jgi:hypothetical protein